MEPFAGAAHHAATSFWSFLNDPAVSAAIAGLVAVVVGFLTKRLNTLMGRKMSAEEFKLLMSVADRAVLAAEQTHAGDGAEAKKAEARRIAHAFLTAYGLDVADKQLDAALEAAVLLAK
jgi:hypothetical protein